MIIEKIKELELIFYINIHDLGYNDTHHSMNIDLAHKQIRQISFICLDEIIKELSNFQNTDSRIEFLNKVKNTIEEKGL